MLVAAGSSLAARDARIASIVGAASLAAWTWQARRAWTPSGTFGAANAVTLLRAALVVVFGSLGDGAATPGGALLLLAAFALDGVDGWLARRHRATSAFGARFDTECDAWTVLVATLVLHLAGRLGAFILVAGVARYAYVLALALVPSARGEEPRSRTGRWAYSLLMGSLCVSAWPLGAWHTPLAMLATALLCASFLRSVVWSWGPVSE